MKICYIIDAWSPVWGGGQEHVLGVGNALTQKNIDITLIVPNLTGKVTNIPAVKFKIKKLGPKFHFPNIFGRIAFAVSSLLYVMFTRYDIYHSHNYSTSALLIIPILFQRKKVIFTLHGAGLKGVDKGNINFLVKFVNTTRIAKIMHELVLYWWPYAVLMTAAASSLVKKPYFTKKVIVVGNGVNVAEFDKVKVVKGDRFRIFWIGRKYDPVKGLKFLEEAVEGLHVTLDAVEGIYGTEKIKRFKAANLYVLPSLSEGFPIVLLEAMAAKLPIITTDVGDCRKLIEAANCGLVIKSVKNLRPAIIKMMKSKDLAIMGERGYEYVKKNYSWAKVAAIYNSYYRGLNP